MTSAEYQNLVEEIARLERELLENSGGVYFRCSRCEKVKHVAERDGRLHDREVECCEEGKCTLSAWFELRANEAERAHETELYNHR